MSNPELEEAVTGILGRPQEKQNQFYITWFKMAVLDYVSVCVCGAGD